MVLTLIMELIKSLVFLILALIPVFPDFQFDLSSVGLGPLLDAVNMFISLSVLGWCLLSILLFYNLRFVWSIIMWIIRKIPGVS